MTKTIGIDARMLGSAQGGLGRYVAELITHLEQLPIEFEFVVFLRQENWHSFEPAKQNFRKVLADIPWYSWAEQTKLSRIIRQEKIDVMHFPHWNVPFFYNKPFVVTIHDLLLLHFPTREASTLGPISYFIKQLAFKLVLWHAALRSRHIITVSQFSKNDIARTLHIPPTKITVTYPAPYRHPSNDSYGQQLIAHKKISKPYALYVGVAYPHKNLNRLLAAWEQVATKTNHRYQLVLVGKQNFFYERLQKKFSKLFAEDDVVFTGYIGDSLLPKLYRNALLFIFPSLYEGFGMPPLEALSYGTPVVASNIPCLHEVLGSAVTYFDPLDVPTMNAAILNALKTINNREITLALAKKELARFSWEKLAKQTSEIYKNSVYY